MTKHTKGPWEWGGNYRGLYGAGPSPENIVLEWQPYEGMWLTYESTREANARLIAAAPDLYEALRNLLSEIYSDPTEPVAPSLRAGEAARAALAKVQQ